MVSLHVLLLCEPGSYIWELVQEHDWVSVIDLQSWLDASDSLWMGLGVSSCKKGRKTSRETHRNCDIRGWTSGRFSHSFCLLTTGILKTCRTSAEADTFSSSQLLMKSMTMALYLLPWTFFQAKPLDLIWVFS